MIAAVFESRAEAEEVAQALRQEGIEQRHIRIADTSTRQQYERRGERGGGFWSWLFGGDDDAWSSDVDYYNEGLGRGGALLTVDTDERSAARVQDILESHGGRLQAGSEAATTGTAAATTGGARQGEREEVLPVVEEQLRIGKRAVTRGGVRVYSRVSERPVEEDVWLREEHVRVDRRAVDRPVTAGADAFRERSIEMEETREEPVVAKEALIIEEVVLSRDVQDRTAKVRDTVRRTDVEVERGDGSEFESDFREHCSRAFGREGLTYEQCAPAYRYGYALGSDRPQGQTGSDWSTVEADARRRWEERNPGTWDRFKSAIRYAWERGRGERRAA
jgi:uncharacterized protein (TIGR02271 family)